MQLYPISTELLNQIKVKRKEKKKIHFDQYELLLLAVKVWQKVNNGSPAPSGGKIQFRTSFHVARIYALLFLK